MMMVVNCNNFNETFRDPVYWGTDYRGTTINYSTISQPFIDASRTSSALFVIKIMQLRVSSVKQL